MQIKWLGHSCFEILTAGKRIVTDPFNSYVGYEMQHVAADIVTVSHRHDDHCAVENVDGDYIVVDTVGEHIFDGVRIEGFEVNHDDKGGRLRGKTIVFVIESEGFRLCHLGDLGESFNEKVVEGLRGIDVLMVPVGGFYTIDAKEALRYCDRINPTIILPMHYKTKDCAFNIAPIDDFLNSNCDRQICYVDKLILQRTPDVREICVMQK
ncbi:MAG: MBL fold metallo-hydrolase [Clostridia bacterium]|nr:MBL fold metallo-hydrolase [Clostridia bacterium]